MESIELEKKISELEQELSFLKSCRQPSSGEVQKQTEEFTFSDIVDCQQLQEMMQQFYDLTKLGVGIIDNKGTILVATGWQEACTKFHRANPESCTKCKESNDFLIQMKPNGKSIEHKCKNGMWDTVFPIEVEGKVLAGIYFGQFFYDDENVDLHFFERQAEKYGFKKKTYLQSIGKVPVLSREKVRVLITFYAKLAQFIADLGYQNILIKRQEALNKVAAQNELAKSESKLKVLFETLPIGITVSDENGKITESNPAAERILGLSVEEIKQRAIDGIEWAIIRLDGEPMPTEEYASVRALKEKKLIRNVEMGVIKGINQTAWISVNAAPLPGYGVVISYEDISARKQAEDVLRQTTSQFRTMFERHSSVMMLIDPTSGAIIDANVSASNFYGYSVPDLCKMSINDINCESIDNNTHERTNEIDQKRNYFIFTHTLRSGAKRTVEVHSSPIEINDKRILFSIIHDITEREKMEKELKDLAIRNQTLLKTESDGIHVLDLKGNIVEANDAFCRLLGYTAEEVRHLNVADWDMKWNKAELAGIIFEFIKEPRMFETKHKRKDGSIIDMEINSVGVQLYGQSYLYAAARNITERKLTEMKIQAQNEELTKMNADKDRFLSILAHDLKNPFNSILGFLELLSNNVRSYEIDKIENHINTVLKSANHVYELLDDILNWSLAQAGKTPFNPKLLNFEEICAEVFDLLSENANAKQIRTNYFEQDNVIIFADKNMFKSILRNLISNAIKFTQHGGRIDVYAECLKNQIQITVADSGIGIDSEKLKKLFDKTQIVTTPGTEKEKGTGLGLLLCQEFVEKHRGQIWAECKPGAGSRFIFTIPNYLS